MTNVTLKEWWLARILDWVEDYGDIFHPSFILHSFFIFIFHSFLHLSFSVENEMVLTFKQEMRNIYRSEYIQLHYIRSTWVLLCTSMYEIYNIHISISRDIRIIWKILMVCHIHLPFSNPLFYSIKLRTSLFKFPCQEEDSHKQLFTYSSNFIPQFWRMWLKGQEMKYDEIRSRARVDSIRTHFEISIKMWSI